MKEQEPVFDANFVDNSEVIQCGSCGKSLEENEADLVEEINEVLSNSDVNGSKANALFSDALETDEKLKELKIIVKMH